MSEMSFSTDSTPTSEYRTNIESPASTGAIPKLPAKTDDPADRSTVRLCHVNCQSLFAKREEFSKFRQFKQFFERHPYDVIAMSETWIRPDTFDNNLDNTLDLPGYELVKHDRQGRTGGGVGIYVKALPDNTIIIERLTDSSFDDHIQDPSEISEYLIIRITGLCPTPFLFAVVYRPSKQHEFSGFEKAFKNLYSSNEFAIIMGDLNINLYDLDNNKEKEWVDFCANNNLFIVPYDNTHYASPTSATWIDHCCLSNQSLLHSRAQQPLYFLSKHDLIEVTLNLKSTQKGKSSPGIIQHENWWFDTTTILHLIKTYIPDSIKYITEICDVSDLNCIINSYEEMNPSCIIRRALKILTYFLICGKLEAHFFVIVLKKSLLTGQCEKCIIFDSLQRKHNKQRRMIYEAIRYSEPTCKTFYCPQVPQQLEKNDSGLYCVEYVRNLNPKILDKIFSNEMECINFNDEIVQCHKQDYSNIEALRKAEDPIMQSNIVEDLCNTDPDAKKAKTILSNTQSNDKEKIEARRSLCKVIINYELKKSDKQKIRLQRIEELASEIQNIVLGEDKDTYYVPSKTDQGKKINTKGMLYNRYRYVLRSKKGKKREN